MNKIPPPTLKQKNLMRELHLPTQNGKLQRFDIRRLLQCPRYSSLRRYLGARQLITIQARESIAVDFSTAYNLQRL